MIPTSLTDPKNGRSSAVDRFNRLTVAPAGFFIDAALGRLADISVISQSGTNPDIDSASTPEDIWSAGGLWVAPTQARIHDVTSSSASDTGSGTGAMSIRIFGLNSVFSEITEVVGMNGVANVATVNEYTRIYSAFVLSSGSNGSNVGNITLTAQTDATVTAQIDAGNGETQMAVYTIPRQRLGLVLSLYAVMGDSGGGSSASADMRIVTTTDVDTGTPTLRVRHTFNIISAGSSYYDRSFTVPPVLESETDIVLRCTSVSNNNTVISGGFDILVVDSSLRDT